MKFIGFILLGLFFTGYNGYSQYYFYNDKYFDTDNDWVLEFGGSVGAMNSLTDLGGKKGKGKAGIKDFNIKNTHSSGSLFLSAIHYNIAFRVEATFGQVSGNDAQLQSVASTTNGRFERNLSFNSSITDAIFAVELYPVLIFSHFDQDKFPSLLQPYVMGGVGYFHFNPQAKLNNNWVDLQPLHTEGQGFAEYPDRKIYQLSQINFPIGFGFKYEAFPFLNLRLELSWRFLTTDYLDDVSTKYIDPKYFPAYLTGNTLRQALVLNDRHLPGAETAHPDGIRGKPDNSDSYFNLNFKMSFIFNRLKR